MDAASKKLFDEHFVCAQIETQGDRADVTPSWRGVDRPETGGYGVYNATALQLAALKAAYESGAMFSTLRVAADLHGKTYIAATEVPSRRGIWKWLRDNGFLAKK